MELSDFRGVIKYKNEFGPFIITKTYYSPNLILKEHVHKNPVLSVILLGGLTESYQGYDCECHSNSILYKPAFEKHKNNIHKNGCHCLNIEFTDAWIEKLVKMGLQMNEVMTLPENSINLLIIRLQNELKKIDYYSVLSLEGIIIEMFTQLFRHKVLLMKKKYPGWFKQVLEDIEILGGKDIPINKLAKDADVHPAHLIKTFKKYFSMTPGEYLRQKKISLVCKALLNKEKSLIRIAHEQNFSDQSHFNRFFKKYIGITPAQYRILNNYE